MSAAPQLHHPSDTESLPRAYNSAAADERALEAGMADTWKRWQGQVVNGAFPLQRYLGGSDHSAVFLTQRGSEKAAIKLIAADPENAEAQFSRWRLAAKLSHPHLLRIFDMGRAKLDNTDLLYLVMEFADDDLSQILPERALTASEAQEMLKPVLRALTYIRGEDCVHGRLRPSNILAVGDEIKISSDSLSASGETTGRKRSVYDAPESASGAISPAADVWSLGVTVVEVLTQRLPDPTQSGHAVLPAGMPPLFQDIARRCLHADPQQRWTVAQIAARLEPAATPTAAASAAAASRLATPIEGTPVHADKKTSAKWLYAIPIVVAGVIAWVLISGSKSGSKTETANPPDQSAQVEQRQVQVSPQPSSAKPEPKRSPVTPAKAPSARIAQEAGHSPSAALTVATAPLATPPKPETAPALKASSASNSAVQGVVHPVMPVVSKSARNTITGKVKVRVRVQVDTSGNVTAAALDSPSPSKYFSRIALEAAQDWKFTPAQSRGQFVPSEWTLRFGFTRSDTEVVPSRITP
jgi:TonB family protein